MTKQFSELALISVPSLVRFDPHNLDRTLLLAQAAAECLTQFGLCTSDLTKRYNADPENFEILLGDLTDAGLAFGRSGFQLWLKGIDRLKAEATLVKFKSALTKQWEKNNTKTF